LPFTTIQGSTNTLEMTGGEILTHLKINDLSNTNSHFYICKYVQTRNIIVIIQMLIYKKYWVI
ncbi:MAG: hypothetical protein MR288_00475, partial [Firmicutes bacterium]|nr:hypothetical protein [Bacillota bacterium]